MLVDLTSTRLPASCESDEPRFRDRDRGCTLTGRKLFDLDFERPADLERRVLLLLDRDERRPVDRERRDPVSSSLSPRPLPLRRFFLRLRVKSRKKNPMYDSPRLRFRRARARKIDTESVIAINITSMTDIWPTLPRASHATADGLGLWRLKTHLSRNML